MRDFSPANWVVCSDYKIYGDVPCEIMPPIHASCDQDTKFDLKEILSLCVKLEITRPVLGIRKVMVGFNKEHFPSHFKHFYY